ncbi:GGDEF domain-containing protein [Blastomonas sp.]|uniref:GGDEF domain-containing protein n=1 Tax=Blastomonas sp. TaxID=1909299 RepID=UPI0035935F09
MKLAASILAGQGAAADDEAQQDSVHENISRQQYMKVISFLEQVQLDPLPDHYRLAWEYLNGGNNMLRDAVNGKLDANGRLSAEMVAEILDECEGHIKVKDLNALVAESEALLTGGFKMLSKSGKESEAYADALQSRLDWMRDLDPSEQSDMPIEAQFQALMKITSQMMKSTRKASQSLDQSTKQLTAMRTRLDEANTKAQRDQLTGLPNRWAFEQQFSAAIIRAKERFEPLSVAFIDIDHFKSVNDTHGHEAGDRVLQLVAKHLDRFGRGNCHLARHGGEEFVIVLENTSTAEAKEQIDVVREDLAERSLVNRDNGSSIGKVTFSAGIAAFNPSEPNRQVLRNADAALYEAKNSGRNQVRIFGAAG